MGHDHGINLNQKDIFADPNLIVLPTVLLYPTPA